MHIAHIAPSVNTRCWVTWRTSDWRASWSLLQMHISSFFYFTWLCGSNFWSPPRCKVLIFELLKRCIVFFILESIVDRSYLRFENVSGCQLQLLQNLKWWSYVDHFFFSLFMKRENQNITRMTRVSRVSRRKRRS